MKRSRKRTILICLCIWVLAAQGADTEVSKGKEYIYKYTKGEPQAMEIYFPVGHDPSTSRLPCMLLFHGGGWGNGDLSTFRYDCEYFASRGIVAATANYFMHSREQSRDLPEGVSRKSACVTDAKSAIRWIKQHASELGIDPRKIIVGGGSAGGHIAILATTSPANDDPSDPVGFDTSVAAYVLFNPALSEQDAEFPDVNALNHLRPGFSPAVVFFGTEDRWKKGWDTAHNRLRELGAAEKIQLWLAQDETHAFFNKQPWKDLSLIKADQFLVTQGYLVGQPTIMKPADAKDFK